MALGATMYVPIVHPGIDAVVRGRKPPGLRSVVLCLEDALHVAEVERGLRRLRTLLADLDRRPRTAGPRIFVRPRNLDMAHVIAGLPGIGRTSGLVVPKLTVEGVEAWWALAEAADLALMPTLERAWVLDPVALSELAAALDGRDRSRLVALRVGGNDLLGLMGLRRTPGATVYDGPLLWGLSQLMCQLGARGYPLTAPVFDVLDDADTLAREARLDAGFGFVGKTAVHPAQIAVIERGFAASEEDLLLAREVLAPEARAVSRRAGRMLEPATHRAWAERTVARAAIYGIIDAAEGMRLPG